MNNVWDHLDHDPTSIASRRQHLSVLITALSAALAALEEAGRNLAALTGPLTEGSPAAEVAEYIGDSLRLTRAARILAHRLSAPG